MKKRVVIADEHDAVREMMTHILATEGLYDVVGEAGNGRDAFALCARCRPDVLIMEVVLPQLSGIEVVRRLRLQRKGVRVLMFSGTLNQMLIVECLKSRPDGFVGKGESLATFLEALRAVSTGKAYFSGRASALWGDALNGSSLELTLRELDVLQLVAESCSSKEIARRLGVSPKTVENHRFHIMEKLHVHDIAALTRYAVKRGIVSSDFCR
jgi:DNA-binding NarL/FixJ family response regulator